MREPASAEGRAAGPHVTRGPLSVDLSSAIRARRPRSPARPSSTARAGGSTNGTVVIADGRIQAVGGPDTPIPAGATRIDGHGKWVTPGRDRRPLPSRRLSVARGRGASATATRRPARSSPKSGPSIASGRRTRASAARSSMAASPRWRSCPARPICSAAASVTLKNVPARTVQGDEVPGRALRPQDGLRRESQAGLRQPNQMPQTRMGNVALDRATWVRRAVV